MIRFRATLALLALFATSGTAAPLLAQPPSDSAPPAAIRPASVDSILVAAAAAAGESRHDAAIALYRRALDQAPWRVEDISAPLAYQYAWAGRLEDSRSEFRRARALRPEDFELRLGELLVLNWMGRHLAAWRGYESLRGRDISRVEPLLGLAAAQRWAGRNDLALASLETARTLDPESSDAASMREGIVRDLLPWAGAYHDVSEDSDGYRVDGTWLEGSIAPHPQWRATPFANRLLIRRDGSPDLEETWVGARVVGRPWTRFHLWSELRVLTEREEGADYAPWTGTASATWTFEDRLRATVTVDRFAAVSYVTRPEKITGESFGFAVSGEPDRRTRLRFAVDHATYGDDNTRYTAALSANREVWAPARVRVGAVGRAIDFDRWLDNGIWTPDLFRSAAATLSFEVRGARWSAGGDAEAGPAQERGFETVFAAGYSVWGSVALGPALLEARAGHAEGNLETGTGYDRDHVHAGARIRF